MANTNELDYSRKVADGERLELIMRQVASRFKLDGNVLAEALLDIHERLKAVEGATEELTSSDRWKAFKTVQLVKPSPSAAGDTVTAIDTVAQDENGELTATKKNIRQGTTSQTGIVQLSDATNSTSTALAATANAVKQAYDLANSVASSGTILANADLNNYNAANRNYLCNATNAATVSNKPSGASGAFELEVIRGTGSSCVQVYYSRDDVNFNYIRKRTGNDAWTGWVKLINSNDTVANATTAEKLGSVDVGLPYMPIYLSNGTPRSLEGYFFSPTTEPSTRNLPANTTLNAVGGNKYVYNVSTSNTFTLTLASTASGPIAFVVRLKCTANCPNINVTYNDAVEKATLTRHVYLSSGKMVDMCFTYYYGFFHLVSLSEGYYS